MLERMSFLERMAKMLHKWECVGKGKNLEIGLDKSASSEVLSFGSVPMLVGDGFVGAVGGSHARSRTRSTTSGTQF